MVWLQINYNMLQEINTFNVSVTYPASVWVSNSVDVLGLDDLALHLCYEELQL